MSRSPDIMNSLGVVLQELGRHGEAIEAFARAIELKADTPKLTTISAMLMEASDGWTRQWKHTADRSRSNQETPKS